MSILEVTIIVVGGLVGWGLVWGLITVIHQQKKPPYDPHAASSRIEGPSVADLGERWHQILEVPHDATPDQIESAYQARLAECDRLTDSLASQKRRADILAAFAFVRGSRSTET